MQTVVFRFLVAGGMATALQYFILGVGIYAFHSVAAVASGIGYLFGSVLNYAINYYFTFSSEQSHVKAVARFYIMVAIGWSINTGCMALLADFLGWNNWLAQALATVLSLVSNFIISKLWVFKLK